jgi:hypothetical protein
VADDPFVSLQTWITQSETSLRARRDRNVVDLIYQGFNLVEAVLGTIYLPLTGGTLTGAGDLIVDGVLTLTDGNQFRLYDAGNSHYIALIAPALTGTQAYILPATDGTSGQIWRTDGSGNLTWVDKAQTVFTHYDATPARASVTNLHGGFTIIATAQVLDSVPTDLPVSTGTGKLVIVINAGTDVVGDITVTGTSVNRETGATTPADTDTITVDTLTTDGSDTDSNGNPRYAISDSYITSKWFTGAVTLSTADLTLTDVDVYTVAFEQANDTAAYEIDTFDSTLLTTGTSAEYDAYLYALEVSGSKCTISRIASLNVGADGETALVDRYWRLRRGNIGKAMAGSTDGFWAEVYYSNSPVQIEDVNTKVWIKNL